MRQPVTVAASILALLLLTACGGSQFEAAAEECGVSAVLTVRDDGGSMTLNLAGDEEGSSGTVDYIELLCITRELEMPSHVLDHISSTRALDGTQTSSWDGIHARWTYHPSSGLRLTLVDD